MTTSKRSPGRPRRDGGVEQGRKKVRLERGFQERVRSAAEERGLTFTALVNEALSAAVASADPGLARRPPYRRGIERGDTSVQMPLQLQQQAEDLAAELGLTFGELLFNALTPFVGDPLSRP